MDGAERVAIAFRLSAAARASTLAGIMARHPDYSASEARRALSRLTLGDEVVCRIWPGEPLVPFRGARDPSPFQFAKDRILRTHKGDARSKGEVGRPPTRELLDTEWPV